MLFYGCGAGGSWARTPAADARLADGEHGIISSSACLDWMAAHTPAHTETYLHP
jgi:hypothetical protein